MNTQTFAQAQNFTAINDEELIAVNGGNSAAAAGWGMFNVVTFGLPLLVDSLTGHKVTKAVIDA